MGVWSGRVLPFPASYIWSFSIPQSMSFRRSLRRLAVVLAFGASSIFWKATAMIIRAQMLMCGKVTHKKLKDNQLTIPCLFIAKVLNLQFDLDKLVYYTYSVDRVEMTNNFQ